MKDLHLDDGGGQGEERVSQSTTTTTDRGTRGWRKIGRPFVQLL
jgi:hypothetical protein